MLKGASGVGIGPVSLVLRAGLPAVFGAAFEPAINGSTGRPTVFAKT